MAEAQHQQRHHEASIPSLLNSHDQISPSQRHSPSSPFPPILQNSSSSPPLSTKLPPIHSSSRPSVDWLNETKPSESNSLPMMTRSPPSGSPIPESNDKQFACGECDQTFSRPHNLKSHLATHSNERSYECEECHHQFRRHHDLKRHQKLHTGEKPYVCAICMRSFARLDALNRHQRAEGGTSCSGVAPAQRRRLTNCGSNSRSNSLGEDVKMISPQTSTTVERQKEENTTSERRSSSFSVLEGSSEHHPDPYRAYTYPVPQRRADRTMTFPPPLNARVGQHVFNLNHASQNSDRMFLLEKRNRELEVEVSTYRASMRALKDLDTLKRKVHDLEIENKVLRSLLVDHNDTNASKRKRRDSVSSHDSTLELQPPHRSPRKETSVAAGDQASASLLASPFGNLPQTQSPEPME